MPAPEFPPLPRYREYSVDELRRPSRETDALSLAARRLQVGNPSRLPCVKMHNVSVDGSICWEHRMPLARQHMHHHGEHIHVAAWPTAPDQFAPHLFQLHVTSPARK